MALSYREVLSAKVDHLIFPLVGASEVICIIDPPDHPNVGDQAIFLGELSFLKRNFPNSEVFFYDLRNYSESAEKYIEKASVLLIHGGGNFGDIWPHHHEMRKRTLERFSHKRIVQLPQSISFTDQMEVQETARLIRAQSSFTLLVRDAKALKFAQEHFECASILCPDMAFAMDRIERKEPSTDVFCLLRTDKEVVADHVSLLKCLNADMIKYISDDWLEEPMTRIKNLDRRLSQVTRKRPWLTYPVRRLMLNIRQRYAEERLAWGISLLSKGEIVVTDRLHAHILSCLMGIPNIALDSWDGKVAALYEAWTGHGFQCEMASSHADVIKRVHDLRMRSRNA